MFLLHFIGQMSIFDSVNHGFTTMATGGFSTRDASIGYYDSLAIESIIIVFMFIGGINFTLIWFLLAKEIMRAVSDEEFKTYLVYIFTAVFFMMVALISTNVSLGDSFRQSLFKPFHRNLDWLYYTGLHDMASSDPVCFDDTNDCWCLCGLNKRWAQAHEDYFSIQVAMRELVRIAQPRKIKQIRMNGEVVEVQQIDKIVGMLFVWIGLFGISSILLAILMLDESFQSIIGITASSLGNTGPALGAYGPSSTWSPLNSGVLIFTSILMWFGRSPVVILLHPRTGRMKIKNIVTSALALFRKMLPGRKT